MANAVPSAPAFKAGFWKCWRAASCDGVVAVWRTSKAPKGDMLPARFQGEGVDLLAATSRDGAVAVWRIGEAEGGLRSEALLSLLLRDAAGAPSCLRRIQGGASSCCVHTADHQQGCVPRALLPEKATCAVLEMRCVC